MTTTNTFTRSCDHCGIQFEAQGPEIYFCCGHCHDEYRELYDPAIFDKDINSPIAG
jgi:tRNA(Ile2) C34 agmatinyltransferase TiaS